MKKYIIGIILSLILLAGLQVPFGSNIFHNNILYLQAKEQAVAFNTKTYKYHKLSCTWAKKCTRNCIIIPKSQAIKRGGVPCKVCGG